MGSGQYQDRRRLRVRGRSPLMRHGCTAGNNLLAGTISWNISKTELQLTDDQRDRQRVRQAESETGCSAESDDEAQETSANHLKELKGY